jgi:uncharacterized cupredoxin-like copper-binding protein
MMGKTVVKMLAVPAMLLVLASCADDDPVAGDDMDDMDAGEDMDDMDTADEHGDFSFGDAAEASEADRVIEVSANDDLSFTPAVIDIAAGEVITFRVTNEAAIAHDFTLGDAETQEEHEVEMASMAGMAMADEPNGFGIEPGETKELTWHFTEAGELLIGCHVPGHYGAGMKADISVST